MNIKFCANCNQNVTPKRKIGVGTFILALCTSGISLLFIPAYAKRCPICQGTKFTNKQG
jgi:RNA polymerase subunit RPABC4/transcription elongation factor Spt4